MQSALALYIAGMDKDANGAIMADFMKHLWFMISLYHMRGPNIIAISSKSTAKDSAQTHFRRVKSLYDLKQRAEGGTAPTMARISAAFMLCFLEDQCKHAKCEFCFYLLLNSVVHLKLNTLGILCRLVSVENDCEGWQHQSDQIIGRRRLDYRKVRRGSLKRSIATTENKAAFAADENVPVTEEVFKSVVKKFMVDFNNAGGAAAVGEKSEPITAITVSCLENTPEAIANKIWTTPNDN
ncbi:hypothetical protein U1Q18_050080, partial [Sarracenia purpurea var. burkii]